MCSGSGTSSLTNVTLPKSILSFSLLTANASTMWKKSSTEWTFHLASWTGRRRSLPCSDLWTPLLTQAQDTKRRSTRLNCLKSRAQGLRRRNLSIKSKSLNVEICLWVLVNHDKVVQHMIVRDPLYPNIKKRRKWGSFTSSSPSAVLVNSEGSLQ